MRVPCKTMSRGNLKPEHKKCIQTLYKYLKDNIDASLIVDFLYQEKLLDLRKRTILLEKRKSEKNELLLRCILNSRALNSFDIFHQSLKSRHKNVYETIENELKRITQTLCGARLEDVVEKREKGEVYLCGLTVLLFSVNKTDSQVVSKTLMNGKPLKKTLGIKMGTTCHSERKLNFVKKSTNRKLHERLCKYN
uniref:CARD domain-containing protein n=1 Tax=Biomphalaria glabrata TaxID=6526 RepID=A0A2C9LKC9_BIOGL